MRLGFRFWLGHNLSVTRVGLSFGNFEPVQAPQLDGYVFID
jgi:hypothetical protein